MKVDPYSTATSNIGQERNCPQNCRNTIGQAKYTMYIEYEQWIDT